ncbi:MAG TPA: flagellar basal-body rod protein FlgF [Alphaproteobacteria bacterium]|nr:flagellar basal-body rod protein FlgF [Alphaproteobacteria bacterium]
MQTPSLVLLSNQQVLQRAMDVVANNVANASTTGYKRIGIEFDTLLQRSTPKQSVNFVVDRATYRDTANGSLETTGNPLDLAIQGEGYFQVQTPSGNRYTRGGSFQLNNQGEIVTASGQRVLDDNGQAIVVPDTSTQLNISGDGFVTARVDNGANLSQLGKIGIVKFANEQQVIPEGGGLYNTTQVSAPAEDSAIMQGTLEQSNVSPVMEMTQMIQIQRAYEQVSNLISQENTRLTGAMTTLSKTTV